MALPVSVQVCTLNEEGNIRECLEAITANEPEDVVVIDGGSTDGTVAIVRDLGVRLIETGRVGLARQRREGYSTSPCAYTAFVDADDRIAADWLETMLRELQAGDYAALQSCVRVANPATWWEHGWDAYFVETIRPTPDTIMVGRPALFRTDALQGIRSKAALIVEDTEMSRDFVERGLRQGIGTAVSYRRCPGSWSDNSSKWRGYGKGYRGFVEEHPERRTALLKHMLFTVPIARAWPPVFKGHLTQPAFGLVMAGNMAAGFLTGKS